MARSGQTKVEFNPGYFETVLRQSKVEQLTDDAAKRALNSARANAPVDTGAYQRGLRLKHHNSRFRRTSRVVGEDRKTLLIESKTGNLARALKAAKQ